MEIVIYVMVPLALILALAGLIGFLWCARGGQFEDLDTPALRILVDEPPDDTVSISINDQNHDQNMT